MFAINPPPPPRRRTLIFALLIVVYPFSICLTNIQIYIKI